MSALMFALAIPGAAAAGTIVVGGGGEPESNQVSLEQDVALASRTLAGRATVLFGGGAASPSVQVLDARPRGDGLRTALGDLFDPRPGRDARYRKSTLAAAAAATAENFEAALESALRADEPLLIYVAAHGEKGDRPQENRLVLWGGFPLTVSRLAELFEMHPERRAPIRLVVTSCYSGGFAEAAFLGADHRRGLAAGTRCGLFAAAWDEEASGCDPNADRAAQEGYGMHFLHALRGEDRSGARLDPALVDLDGNGTVSLLEAHTRARIASSSLDTPTSTSERWLREAAPVSGGEEDIRLVEEEATIAALSARLGLAGRSAAEDRLRRLDAALREQDEEVRRASEEEDERALDLRIRLLERWPVLDDPWHPDFPATLEANREEIRHMLERSPEAAAYDEARRKHDRRAVVRERLLYERALLRRLVQAHETRTLARRLARAGGSAWRDFERLRACERSAP